MPVVTAAFLAWGCGIIAFASAAGAMVILGRLPKDKLTEDDAISLRDWTASNTLTGPVAHSSSPRDETADTGGPSTDRRASYVEVIRNKR